MPLKSGIVRGVDYRYFYCQHAASQAGEGGCTKEYMWEDVLNEAVGDSVKGLLAAAGSFKKAGWSDLTGFFSFSGYSDR